VKQGGDSPVGKGSLARSLYLGVAVQRDPAGIARRFTWSGGRNNSIHK